jgi:hypothetical protein
LDAAYDSANASSDASIVLIRGGTYAAESITGNRTATGEIVFAEAGGERVIINSLKLGTGEAPEGPDRIRITGIETGWATAQSVTNQRGVWMGPGTTYVTLVDIDAGNFGTWLAENITIRGGDWGPCRAVTTSNVCDLNRVDVSKNVVVDGADIHDYGYSNECVQAANCHWRSIYVNGVDGFTLRNSTVRESVFAPWTTISGSEAAARGNQNILIENNQFGASISGVAGSYREFAGWENAWCQNGGQPSYKNVTIRFNSFARATGINLPGWYDGESGCRVQNFQVYGNVFGSKPSCTTSGVQWHHNVYAGRYSGTCGSGDVNIGGTSMPFYADDDQGPEPGDYALAGPSFAGDNLVPTSAGCPATDEAGRPRGQNGFCDAGASER